MEPSMQPAHANTSWAPVGLGSAVVLLWCSTEANQSLLGQWDTMCHHAGCRPWHFPDRATGLSVGLSTLGSILLSDPRPNHPLITRWQIVTPLLFESESSLFPKQKAAWCQDRCTPASRVRRHFLEKQTLDLLFPPQGSDLIRNSGLETTASCRPCRRLPPATALSLPEHLSSAPADEISLPRRAGHTSPSSAALRLLASPLPRPVLPPSGRRESGGGRREAGAGGAAAAGPRQRRAGQRPGGGGGAWVHGCVPRRGGERLVVGRGRKSFFSRGARGWEDMRLFFPPFFTEETDQTGAEELNWIAGMKPERNAACRLWLSIIPDPNCWWQRKNLWQLYISTGRCLEKRWSIKPLPLFQEKAPILLKEGVIYGALPL